MGKGGMAWGKDTLQEQLRGCPGNPPCMDSALQVAAGSRQQAAGNRHQRQQGTSSKEWGGVQYAAGLEGPLAIDRTGEIAGGVGGRPANGDEMLEHGLFGVTAP